MRTLSEIAFFTDDVSRMSKFYEAILENPPVAGSEDMAIFMSGDTKIFIHRNYSPQEGELPAENHFAYTVADVGRACQDLQNQGYKIGVVGKEYFWGFSAYLRDPDGHLIELIQQKDEA